MFWLYLLAAVTVLGIILRRTRRKMKPLDDELYAKTVAIDHVQSGVAWVRADGTFGSVNPSFARTFNFAARDVIGKEWTKMFPPEYHDKAKEQFSQTLLLGTATFNAPGIRSDALPLWLNVQMVAVHDHHMRFAGFHCLVEDRTRLCELEENLRTLSIGALTVNAGKRESQRPESPAPAERSSPAGPVATVSGAGPVLIGGWTGERDSDAPRRH
jgi:PAS domain S-box-containing protein